MTDFKQMKTAKLGIVLQLTEVPTERKDQRLWEVHDVERNRGFHVSLAGRPLLDAPPADLEGAIGLAIERFLTSSPELVAGPIYEVQVTPGDLSAFKAL